MQVIGLCRFSYPAVAGYKIAHATTAEPCDFLYHPTRLKMRFRHLESTCVPALAAQTDPDFLFVIVIEDNLLDRYNMCLLELTAGLSQVVIVAPPRALSQGDAIAVDYVQLLRETAAESTTYLTQKRQLIIDFNHEFVV